MEQIEIFKEIFKVIESRKLESPDASYVAKLMHKGTSKINKKILEEAYETAEAALEDDKEHLIYEMCDLLFHTFVLAGYKDITLDDLQNELSRRFGKSGLQEKAERTDAD